jgi:hypothetical protein
MCVEPFGEVRHRIALSADGQNPSVLSQLRVTTVTALGALSPSVVQLKAGTESFVKERLQSVPDVLLSGPFKKVSSVPRNGFSRPKVVIVRANSQRKVTVQQLPWRREFFFA